MGNNILQSLQDAGFQITSIGNLRARGISGLLSYLKKAYYTYLISKTFFRDREPSLLKDYSDLAKKLLASIQYDVLFSPGTLPIAFLQVEKPIVFWTDSTFAGMVDFYPEFTNLCDETLRNGNKLDQSALSKCRIAIFASEWAANIAIQKYDVDPKKVKVVPFGANLKCNRNSEDISRIVENRDLMAAKYYS